ncbi:MAG: DNA-binding protein [Legionellaceae bacterium]|nr:DNA-binding protein [Legionellaceae bacterium]|tara:strand:- start:1264 stop:1470 length:207 start_codon:yes stop_codon:yes gene_type:complete
MTKKYAKKFIAGAVCPKCQATDTLIVDQGVTPMRRECVNCGFQQAQGEALQSSQESIVHWVKPGEKSS